MVAFTSPDRKSQRLIDLKFVQSESEVRDRFRQTIITEQELFRIRRVTGIDDDALIRRLHDAGFRAETVNAIALFPVAMAAWASGSVTERERRNARQAALALNLSAHAGAVELFHQWLCQKPAAVLWDLWRDYSVACAAVKSETTFRSHGMAVYQLALLVAEASGGFLGMGGVCTAEQQVLDRIRETYALE